MRRERSRRVRLVASVRRAPSMLISRYTVRACRGAAHRSHMLRDGTVALLGGTGMARQLWLLRHAEAEPHGTRSDSERRLTERGRAAGARGGRGARAAGRRLRRGPVQPEGARARRPPSWRPRLERASSASCCAVHAPLAGGFDGAAGARRAAPGSAPTGALLLVGHEPDLSRVVGDLTADAST